MKVIILCLLVASHTLAAPNKRDVDYFHYYELPSEYGVPVREYVVPHEEYGVPHEQYGVPHEEYGVPQEKYFVPVESTTHYCPEEDIQAPFIPSPPEIKSFPLPELQIVKNTYPAKQIVSAPYPAKQEIPAPEPVKPHEEYGVPHENSGVIHQESEVVVDQVAVPHEEYGVPHEESGGSYESSGIIVNEEAAAVHVESTTTPAAVAVHSKYHKLKSHISKVHQPVVHYIKPKIVIYKKKIEFPFLKKLFKLGHH